MGELRDPRPLLFPESAGCQPVACGRCVECILRKAQTPSIQLPSERVKAAVRGKPPRTTGSVAAATAPRKKPRITCASSTVMAHA